MFDQVYQNMTLSGKSSSTFQNYIRTIASISLYFKKIPLELSDDQINDYLLLLKEKQNTSYTIFKHYVYALRYVFRLSDRDDRAIQLPSLKRNDTIPDILSVEECKIIFKTPKYLKHRVLFALTYSAGLRIREVARLKVADLDFDRMTIYIRDTKYSKNRIVPLSKTMKVGLEKYLKHVRPKLWLFEGYDSNKHLATNSIGSLFRETLKKTNIKKRVTIHTLRHTYATHCIEMGMDPFTLKELLGHEALQTTMLYLNLATVKKSNSFSPFDKIYETKN
ncbi:integrase [Flammeovirga pectinis]|uniref:Integrase n=1 Tax=Flammeovirga pectinis TaxID=2494373 RepID=A0A3Q9FQ57_9BACT|nr:tyrosine-type recombinase/integrase [Flammeovirga pectinis]AZQ65383.1 integrase [Flammeovirga pectinis]